jgi:hypothetical protein
MGLLSAQGIRSKSSDFLNQYVPIVATMDLSWPRWCAEAR